jgi:hypothetical protein
VLHVFICEVAVVIDDQLIGFMECFLSAQALNLLSTYML